MADINTYYIPSDADVYEVVVRDNIIVRIIKIMGDTQLRFPIDYDDLGLTARWDINEYIQNLDNND